MLSVADKKLFKLMATVRGNPANTKAWAALKKLNPSLAANLREALDLRAQLAAMAA